MPGFYEVEDNDDATQANALPPMPFPASQVRGSLGAAENYFAYDGDTVDWYSFTTTASGFLHLTGALQPQAGAGAATLAIYRDLGGGNLEQAFTQDYTGELTSSIYLPLSGAFYLKLSGDTYIGDYTLGLSFSPASLYETESNDTADTADPLPPLPVPWGAVFGSVGYTATPDVGHGEVVYEDLNDEDWFKFTLDPAGPVQIELYPMFGLVDFELYDVNGTALIQAMVGGHTPERMLTVLPAGDYTIRVMVESGSAHANYFLSVLSAGDIGWYTTEITGPSLASRHFSLAMVDGRPAVAYAETDTGPLKYVRADDAWGIGWGTPQTVADDQMDGRECSMALINGKPAVSYFSESMLAMVGVNYLGYVQALDPQGTAWRAPLAVDGGGGTVDMGRGTSLCEVNGYPAISYYSAVMPLTLYYTRAKDADGAAWNTRTLVSHSTGQPEFGDVSSSLRMVGANPAVAFYRDALDLLYLRANDTDGSNWNGEPAVIYAGGPVLGFAFEMSGGCPALAFHAEDTALGYGNILRFIRSTDGLGTAWPAAVDLDTTGDASTPSLATINMLAGMAYCDVQLGKAKFIWSANMEGSNWFSAEEAAAGQFDANPTGPGPALIEIDSRPAIAYFDAGTGQLMFAVKL